MIFKTFCFDYIMTSFMLSQILHHGLSMLAMGQALLSGQVQFYILIVLFTEITTPFVNLRW